MNSKARTLAGVATALASLAIGVVGARALGSSDEESAASAVALPDTVVVDGVSTPIEETVEADVPIIAPVMVGDDPAILDELLAGPVGGSGQDGEADDSSGSEIIGAVTKQMAYSKSGDGEEQIHVLDYPFAFDFIADRFLPFPVHAYDLCAGRRPGTHTAVPRAFGSSAGCPAGFAGTINGLFAWPAPTIRGQEEHHLTASGGISQTCPADTPAAGDGQTPVTAFSSIPLAGLLAELRPYGTSRTWDSLDLPGTSTVHAEHWASERAAGIFTNDALLPHCFVVDTDQDVAYEMRLFGTDADGNTYESEPFVLWGHTTGRPPTQVTDVDPLALRASVLSYTVEGGSVEYLVRAMADDTDTTCPSGGSGFGSVSYIDVDPADALSAEYPREARGWIPLNVGSNLLCARILGADGSLVGLDTLVVRTPTLQRPVITLAGVRLNPGVTIPGAATSEYGAGELGVVAQPFGGTCTTPWWNDADLTGATPAGDVQALYDCGSGPSDDLTDSITVNTSRRWSAEVARRTYRSIPVSTDVCDPTCPRRPTEWYEIPIPSAEGDRCGERSGEFTAECTVNDGVAILRVDYDSYEGAPGSAPMVTLIESGGTPASVAPVVQVVATTVGSFADWGAIPVTVRIESDVEVELVDVVPQSTAIEETCGVRPTFDGIRGTTFDLGFTVCAAASTSFTVRVVDGDGIEYEVYPVRADGSAYTEIEGIPSVVSESLHATFEFLGGDAPRFGFLSEFGFGIAGNAGAYRGLEWSGTAGTEPGCISMDDSVFQSATDPRIAVMTDGAMWVNGVWNVRGDGEDDCGDPSVEGPNSYMEVEGLVSLRRLQAGGPIVLVTPSTWTYRLARATLTGEWHLELAGVRV